MTCRSIPGIARGCLRGLQLDAYNAHYVELSKAANSSALVDAIKRVMQVRTLLSVLVILVLVTKGI